MSPFLLFPSHIGGRDRARGVTPYARPLPIFGDGQIDPALDAQIDRGSQVTGDWEG